MLTSPENRWLLARNKPTFPEALASRVARLEEARNAVIERRETDVEAFVDTDAALVERMETALAEIDRSLTASGF